MRGRRPKPTFLKLVHGNPGKRALRKNEPKPVGNLIDAPDWFTPDQVDHWTYAIQCAPRGLLTRLDRALLVSFVCAETMHAQAMSAIAKSGALLTQGSQGQPIVSPYVRLAALQSAIMIRCAAELGFTPASRSRISAPTGGAGGVDDGGDDDFEAYLRS